jgi:acid phosphatase
MRVYLYLSGLFFFFNLVKTYCQTTVPYHDHVVIVILENKDYGDIIGDKNAPYINNLLKDANCALLEKYFALTHPSQPNYIMMFSGDDQGVILDFDPFVYLLPFTTQNLGGSLIDSGYSFIGYSEDLPSAGYTGSDQGEWARKHCPWVNWQDASKNGIPSTCNLLFTSFPTNYDSLPTLCFVIPNLINDMHDGTVAQGDAWVKANMDAYAQWAKTHNSLLIITFDETESYISNNKVPAIFVGENVVGGPYGNVKYDHYDLLKTLEEMYGLPYAGESANGILIEEIWKAKVITAINENNLADEVKVEVYPNPAITFATIKVKGFDLVENVSALELKVYDLQGKEVSSQMNIIVENINNEIKFNLDCKNISSETYFYELSCKGKVLFKDKLIIQ